MFLIRVCNLMMMFNRRSIPLIRFSAGARARQGGMNKIGWRYGLMWAVMGATPGWAGTMPGRCVSIRTTCLSRLLKNRAETSGFHTADFCRGSTFTSEEILDHARDSV